jgi:Ca-activated chloride channel homolog
MRRIAASSLFACACALAVALPASASASSSRPSRPTEGTLTVRDGRQLVDVPLKHTDVRIRVAGFLADVEVEQTFVNPYAKKIDAVYLFPLPTGAAVGAMDIDVGARTIRGSIERRAEARRKYEEARGEGHVAALLTQERPNLFTQAVANLEPGAKVVVRLRYVQPLEYEAGGYELAFPMVAGPRYVPKSKPRSDAGGAAQPDRDAVAPAVLPPGFRSSHDIGVDARIDAGVPIMGISSPSHRIVVDGGHVTLAAGDTIPNKDFILRYQVAGARPELATLAYRAPGAAVGSLFLLAQPPGDAGAAEITPREMVFVVDTSSSMAGEPLAKAKDVVRRALAAMAPDDTFQIIRFDDRAGALGALPIANRPPNIAIALRWLDGLEAGGGTDMTTGISAALDFPHDPARLRVVAFLTDGYIGNEDEVLALVGKRLGPSRLFSFGVGSAVNRYLLEEMARIGRGVVQVVRPDEDTRAATAKFHERIARPLLTDVRIDWAGLDVRDQVPAAIPDLFLGQPLVVAARYGRAGGGVVTVHARKAGQPVAFRLPVSLPARDETRPAVASVWARARIAELSREMLRAGGGEQETAGLREQITAIALAHKLMSAYTAFVAVDTTRVTAGGPAAPVAVPVEVPRGVRRTARGSGAQTVLGGAAQTVNGSDAQDVIGDLIGNQVGKAYGVGGLGVVGTGVGSGGTAQGTIDLGNLGTIGKGDGPASASGYGHGAGGLGGRRAAVPAIVVGHATVRGSLNIAIIKRVFDARRNEVRACYEAALQKNPAATGRVELQLTILPNGSVAAAVIAKSELDGQVGACIAAASKKWSFPAVPTGGVNQVNYPFVFKPAAAPPRKREEL